MSLAQPVTNFHTASPPTQSSGSNVPDPESIYPLVIVTGTHNILHAASEVKTVKALINSSTSGVMTDNVSHMINCKDDSPILRECQRPPNSPQRTYCLSKAEAEEAIRFANRNTETGGGLLTVSLRPGLVFGERNTASLGKMVARQGKSRFQIGDGQNPYDFIYAGNLADAHLLSCGRWLMLRAKNHLRIPQPASTAKSST
ncbi:3-beta hydroxysteroid dehydrogenase/isomerase family-domain-containing protein [Aspergillus oleicola]